MKHEPCGVLAEAERLTEFIAGDAVLAVGQHPDRAHRLIETERRGLIA